jgi:thiol-disulfide isomerase/thioredoxin
MNIDKFSPKIGHLTADSRGKTCRFDGMKRSLMALLFGLVLQSGARSATLEEIIGNPQLWPLEVTVTAATKAGVVMNGQVSGAMLIGAGKKITIMGVAADGVTGKLGGATVRVALDKTDLLQRANGRPGGVPVTAAPAHEPAAPTEKSAPLAANGKPTEIQRQLLGKLVKLENGTLQPFDMRKLNGVKYYGLMFSAGWCEPCRDFAPRLLEGYRNLRAQYPEFELVLVSNDHSSAEMLAYMREEKMPWPAIKYSELDRVDQIMRLAGPGIPCLVLVDGDGTVLAHSFKGREYLGPDSVLEATERVLRKNHGG